MTEPRRFSFSPTDGGRASAGFKGRAGDCVTRAIAIASHQPYLTVYRALNDLARAERPRRGRRSSARNGVSRATTRRYLETLGWRWTPTMGIGTGCRVHLRPGELPVGTHIASLSGHLTAVRVWRGDDGRHHGIIYDAYNPDRGGSRCVYGYWSPPVPDKEDAP